MAKLMLVLMLAMAALAAPAREVLPAAADPLLEKRVEALSAQLRCLVCQNQSLADSHAELALDLKNQVREKLGAGLQEREVVDFMVARYGDFVLYRPPLRAGTWLLWFGPFLLLAAGFGLLYHRLARRRPPSRSSDAELKRAAALLEGATETGDKT